MYFQNSHDRRDFPIPATPITEAMWALRPSALWWNSSLMVRSSASRPTNGASRPVDRWPPPTMATTRSARHSSTGSVLPLRSCVPAPSYTMAASVDRSGVRRCLDTRGRVHQVAGHHPLPGGADGHGGLTGEHAGPSLEVRPPDIAAHLGHALDQVEAGPHGPLGVVLLGHRGPP